MKSSIASFKAALWNFAEASNGVPRARRTLLTLFLVTLAACLTPARSNADALVDAINTLRARGCAGARGTPNKLERTPALDAVAQAWSKGGRLRAALERTHYRATNSSSMRISGTGDNRALVGVLADNYCSVVTDASFTDIGIQRHGQEIWIVVAAPLNLPSPQDAKRIEREVLARVNAARAEPRKCGRTLFKAAPSVTLSATLNRAALLHAQDMARHDHFEHEGTDGSTPAERLTRVGYAWQHVAENIAAGAPTAEAVVEGWLKSPGHCANIMGAAYREMGIAFALEPKSDSGIYWSQEFATRR